MEIVSQYDSSLLLIAAYPEKLGRIERIHSVIRKKAKQNRILRT